MAMTIDEPTPEWRNFAIWSAVGAVFYALILSGFSLLVNGEGLVAIFKSKVAPLVGLALIVSAASVGFSMRKSPISLRRMRNFLISNAAAILVLLLVVWGFSASAGLDALGAMGASEWAAAVLGLALVFFAFMGGLAVASAHSGADLIEDKEAADQMRERGRLMLYSFAWMAPCGLLLIGLSLAGPGGLLSPAPALVGLLVLLAVATALSIAVWRLMDELDRTLSQEAGNIAFYLILLFGGGWAMLARLGFVAAPAPLDWLTMFTFIIFVASFVAVGRRKLLTR